MWPLLLTWSLAIGADMASTEWAIAHGAHEALLPANRVTRNLILGGELVGGALILRRLHRTQPGWTMAVGYGAAGFRIGVAIHNVLSIT